MKKTEKDALRYIENLLERYYEGRDLKALPLKMSEEVSLIGTGDGEEAHSREEVRRALTLELMGYPDAFQITRKKLWVRGMGENTFIVYGNLQANPYNPNLAQENVRITAVINQTEAGFKLQHIHMSHPDYEQRQGEFFVTKAARNEGEDICAALNRSSELVSNLLMYMPAGVYQCRNDEDFTLVSMSNGFLTMFGYTREEIEEKFHNHYLEMIHPADRKKVKEEARNKMETGQEIGIEYRVMHKKGTPVWVLDKSRLLYDGKGGKSYYCVLVENTENKWAREELRLSLERHMVIMDQTTEIIFEWDMRNDSLIISPNWYKKFGYVLSTTNVSKRAPLTANVYKDDIPLFTQVMYETTKGKPYGEVEIRMRHASGRYIWCCVRVTSQYDIDGNPIKSIGVIRDIDEEKKQRIALYERAQRDSLTGLYNKMTIHSAVNNIIKKKEPEDLQLFIILDIDYFKSVNDTYGHIAGDNVLICIGEILKKNVRSSDVVGRIGGDEFIIYLSEIADEESAEKKAFQILEQLHGISPIEGKPPISCSMGSIIFSGHTQDYQSLYRKADEALYRQKENGRNGISFEILK